MKNLFILSLVIAFFSISGVAQKLPTFAQYGARDAKIKTVRVNVAPKDAHLFRTNLRNAAKEGVNFAGRYVLTGWGCGTNCSQWAIIDGSTGKVYFPKKFEGVAWGFCDLPKDKMPSDTPGLSDEASGPLYYKKSSRLVVLTGFTGGALDNAQAKCGNYFFEWTGTRLRQVRFVAGKRTDTP